MAEQLQSRIIDGLKELWEKKMLTDYTVIVCYPSECIKINCHKVVLFGISEYFRTIFQSQFQDRRHNRINLSYENVDANCVTEILNHACGYPDLNINTENYLNMLKTADYLDIEFIKKKCSTFLVKI